MSQQRSIDWPAVQGLRLAAADIVTRDSADDASGLLIADSGAERERIRAIVTDLVRQYAENQLLQVGREISRAEQQLMARAVFDAMVGLGRLQPLIDDDEIENIEINGCDDVTLVLADGQIVDGPPVAEDDDELVREVNWWLQRSGSNRQFSESAPIVHLSLPDGSRMAATRAVSPRPSVVIRRHRLTDISLGDLVERDALTMEMARFLRAAVRAKMSIVVSGQQGAGKTTLVRALCNEMDPHERIGTIETEFELFLHQMPERHRRVVAWEARPGGSERRADGRPVGEVSLTDLLEASLRFNLNRIIVGEVRGPEVLPMFEAMQAGAGSLSTTHSHSAIATVQRLVTLGLRAGPDLNPEFLYRQVAEFVNLIVQTSVDDTAHGRRRYISEVVAVEPGEDGRPATTHVFATDPDGVARVKTVPPFLEERFALSNHGWHPISAGYAMRAQQ